MTIDLDDDKRLDAALDGPLLELPDDFTARVMAALPARPAARRGWRLLSALVVAACGALGAVEVLLFVSGLWTATAVAVG
jgi:hypothetical protein